MKHYLKHTIGLVLLLFVGHCSCGQGKSFSPDNAVFIEEFKAFIDFTGQPNVVAKAKVFKRIWENDSFSDVQKTQINRLCNNMRIKDMPVEPYFSLVMESLINFRYSGLGVEVLQQWRDISSNLLKKGKNKDYLLFLNTTNLLFRENGLYTFGNRLWRASNNQFEIIYDKNTFAIKFDALDLICTSLGDKINIWDTKGVYYPVKGLWVGKGGSVDWQRVSLDQEKVFCHLDNYEVSLKSSSFTADSVEFYNKHYFEGPLLGSLIEKISNATNPDKAVSSSYPRFTSFTADVEIKGLLGKNAKYIGGFSMYGPLISGTSKEGDLSIIEIYYKGEKVIESKSKNFNIIDGVAQSAGASFELFTDSGTIFHPKVIFNFQADKKILKITKGTDGLMRVPFTDSYHNLEIDVQQVLWNLDEPLIDFDMIDNSKAATIESSDFYRSVAFEKVQGRMRRHPLTSLRKFAMNLRQKKFATEDFVAFLNTKKQYIYEMLLDLHDGGYIYYYPEEDSIYVKKKTFNYVSAYFKVRDYDNIKMTSVIGAKPNITLNIKNFDLNVEGVRKFIFSDSQFVVVAPREQKLRIGYDRTMHFDGQVRAGRFDLFGEKFEFKYGAYDIHSKQIDSMRIFFPDETGEYRRINSVLSDISGTLYIDNPKNKSGLANYPDYPRFVSEKGSLVHYERPGTHESQYKKESFFFEVDPFAIDSMDNFTREQLRFDGTFRSGGIFPDFKNQLTIQDDFSLGFKTATPPGGYPMYDGKGKAELALALSNEGLYGSGLIEYSTSKSMSDKYLILPEKTVGNSNSFTMPQSAKYPIVDGLEVYTEWVPNEDYMNISKRENNFKVYNMAYDFDGDMTLSPSDLRAQGSLIWDEAIYSSQDMVLETNKAKAEHGGIKIKAAGEEVIAFENEDTKGFCDFTSREGKFASNLDGAQTRFPLNKYISSMADYRWDMNAKTIDVKPGKSLGGDLPEFISVKQGQDSLRFESQLASFDLITAVLDIEQVPHIDIADSRVFPDLEKVTVRRDAKMDTLFNSKILANKLDKFHNVFNCTTRIDGFFNMQASGNYIYTNKQRLKQEMYFDSIIAKRLDSSVVGYGYVSDTQNFTMDTKLHYKGGAEITSKEKPIHFKGYIKPEHVFTTYYPSMWIKFEQKVDPANVIVNVSDPRGYNRFQLDIGLYYAMDSAHVYPSIFGRKRRRTDPDIVIDTGILYFNHELNSFMIGSEDKLLGSSRTGNIMRIDEGEKTIYTEGKFDFDFNFMDGFDLNTAGNASLKEGDSTFVLNMAFGLEFDLPKSIQEKIYSMAMASGNGTAASANTDFTKSAISELVPTGNINRVVKRIESSGKAAPGAIAEKASVILEKATDLVTKDSETPFLESALLVSHSQWYFDHRHRSLMSYGDISIAALDGKNVNRSYKCVMGLEKRRSGDKLDVYIEFNEYEWIYMNYVRGVLYIFSSDNDLNELIVNHGGKVSNGTYKLRKGTPRGMYKLLDKVD